MPNETAASGDDAPPASSIESAKRRQGNALTGRFVIHCVAKRCASLLA